MSKLQLRNRRAISGTLLAVVALIPLVFVIDFTLILVSFPNAMEYVVAIDAPAFAVVGAMVLLSRRKKGAKGEAVMIQPITVMDKLKERNGGRRAPSSMNKEVPLDAREEETADVFLGETDAQGSAQNAEQTLQLRRAKGMDLGLGHIPEVEAKEPLAFEPEQIHATPAGAKDRPPRGNWKQKDYVLSPDKLQVPAFICRCGHPHRFVCLTCGTTVDQAVKKTKTHWVEWTPEMGAVP